MMNLSRRLLVGLVLMSLLGGSALAQTRIATVDLRKVFDGYWKKRQAEAALKDRQTDMEKEDRNMVDDYKKVKDDYQSLLASANDQAVSTEERDKRKNAAEEKLRRMKEMEETIAQYERQARTTIGEQSQRMRSNILTEIRNVVNAKAKTGGYSLVIDTAAETINSTPVFLYASTENDITDSVLQQLNATAPADALKADEKPAADDKKKDSKK
ncbi:MAG TPA: OmpH family outer membrane protein [Verrucomicrobiae bacterium]|nr:OmpH family outer membrane protein [Verrucomicrobiae bacterium]